MLAATRVCSAPFCLPLRVWGCLRLQNPGQWGLPALVGLLQALVPALLMNVSIVGLNQLYDVEIDKINKPYLPLASGEMTQAQVH